MRRRAFLILLIGGVILLPLVPRAQPTGMPVIGFLNSASPGAVPTYLAAFYRGLNAGGYVEGRNVAIDYRWAEADHDRLQELAADLVRRRVAMIVATGGTGSVRAARNATETIPVLLVDEANPVSEGLVSSISRPGRNATGASLYTSQLGAKRLELLRELVPRTERIALLVNPGTVSAEIETKDLKQAAAAAGLQLLVLDASPERGFESAFAAAVEQRADALIVSGDPAFTSRRARIIELAATHRLPAAYPWREYALDGGLMSYGPSVADAYRQIGDYASRILKGAKPGDLPVQLPTRFELILNLRTAKALGITMPLPLLVAASEVIE